MLLRDGIKLRTVPIWKGENCPHMENCSQMIFQGGCSGVTRLNRELSQMTVDGKKIKS